MPMLPNIKYELQELERLLSSSSPSGEELFVTFEHKVTSEIDRIKQTFIQEVFSFEDERHLERYIQYHQQALIQLMDKSALLISSNKASSVSFFQILYNSFEHILSFIERHFTKYFDQDAKAPEGYIAITRKDARVNLRKLQKAFSAKGADIQIIDLLLHVLKKIIEGHAVAGVTYRKVLYSKELQKEMFRLAAKPTAEEDINDELRMAMYYLNYNSTRVLTYHAHYISALLEKSETRSEKIERLSFELKKLIQAQVKPGISYHPSAPSLKSQLVEYIKVELKYQERLQKINHDTDPPPGSLLDGFKLKFDASVAQLAYLLRIFIETKLILNNNLSQLMAFIARFIVTKKSENVSAGTLRSKFYNIEAGTKESVRNILVTMLQYIDKN